MVGSECVKLIEHDILRCYEILDLQVGATPAQIRKAYVELAHVWDPERHTTNPPLKNVAEQKRRDLDAAYHALQEFLPELRNIDSTPNEPVRPDDAISDQIIPEPAVRAPVMLMVFVGFIILNLIVLGTIFLHRRLSHVPDPITQSIPEE